MSNALQRMLSPSSVAIIGASRDKTSVGYGILKNVLASRFAGRVYAINPFAKSILGQPCRASVLDVPGRVDLALVAVPASKVVSVAKECGEKGVFGLAVVSAGFAETPGGKALQDELVVVCKRYGMRLLGPNCMGFLRPALRLNASFAVSAPPAGGIAFVSQSGAIADSVIDWALRERYAFSLIASLGNSADVDAADLVDFLSHDPKTKAIALYLEGLGDGRRFALAAKKCGKPVVVLKAGRTAKGSVAASSHTGALAGAWNVFRGAMRQSNVVLAEGTEELFDFAKALAEQPLLRHNSVAVITNGGGPGVLAADYASDFGLELASLPRRVVARLERGGVMHSACAYGNPLDLIGDALPDRYEAALDAVVGEPSVGGVIVIQTLQTMTDPAGNARAIVAAKKRHPGKPVIAVFMGGRHNSAGERVLEAGGVPNYNDVRKAMRAMAALAGSL
ncbi:hypothetical protein AUJ14_02280 [Candidatus Micrarchaeota archaeon CG1_02_55_22]|nr:MAG: hypothetical protein AUJ14_02280 [Candidatus Micrarchaeota archaeon CG1_02_55_22]